MFYRVLNEHLMIWKKFKSLLFVISGQGLKESKKSIFDLNDTSKNWHLKKMTPRKNDTQHKWHGTLLLLLLLELAKTCALRVNVVGFVHVP